MHNIHLHSRRKARHLHNDGDSMCAINESDVAKYHVHAHIHGEQGNCPPHVGLNHVGCISVSDVSSIGEFISMFVHVNRRVS